MTQVTKIGFTRGTFQLIHPGHIRFFEQAKSIVDVLYVFIDSDDRVEHLKGMCITSASDREAVLHGLKNVDYVKVFDCEDDFDSQIKDIIESPFYGFRQFLYLKGGDYKPNELPEYAFLDSLGITVCCLGHTGHSTTDIVNRIKNG